MEDMTARAQALSEMSVNLQKIAGQFNIEKKSEEVCEPIGQEVGPSYTRKKDVIRLPPKTSMDAVPGAHLR